MGEEQKDISVKRTEKSRYSRREFLRYAFTGAASVTLAAAIPRNVFASPAVAAAATEQSPKPKESDVLSLKNFHLTLNKDGVPVSYHFGENGSEILFTTQQIEQFETRIQIAKDRREYVPVDEVLTDPESYVPITDLIAPQNTSEEEASETIPDNVCDEKKLRNHGVIIHNPGPDAPNVLIRSGAFEPSGPLYPVSLLAKLEGETILELFTVNNVYLDDTRLTNEQRSALESYETNNPMSVYAKYLRAKTSNAIENFRRHLLTSHNEKVREAENRGATAEICQLYLESQLISTLPAASLTTHYAAEVAEFNLGVSRGITSQELGQSQQLVMVALGYPPPEFDTYSFVFEPSGKPRLVHKRIEFNSPNSHAAQNVKNRRVSLPSPDTRKLLEGVDDLAATEDAYVVNYTDFGFILNHEFTHVRNNAVERLIELKMLRKKSDGTLEVVEGSRLEELFAVKGTQETPWFMSQQYPINMERKTDEAARTQMDVAYGEWLNTGSDESFPFVITVPGEHGKPVRYKVTQSRSDVAV